MKKATTFSCFIFLFNIACTNKTDQNTVASLEGGIENSNKFIIQNTEFVLKSLENKTTNPATKEKAEYWFPKAKEVKNLSEEMSSYVDTLEKGRTMNSLKSDELWTKLRKNNYEMTSIDSLVARQFLINYELHSTEAVQQAKKRFYNTFFKNADAVNTSAMLSRIKNDIRLLENKIITFCDAQIGSLDGDSFFNEFSAIAALSSSYVKAGEEIEITAGLGSFIRKTESTISVNGIPIIINYNGAAIYKFEAPVKPGKYVVPVRIDFYDQDGNKQYMTKQLEYTVAKLCDQ